MQKHQGWNEEETSKETKQSHRREKCSQNLDNLYANRGMINAENESVSNKIERNNVIQDQRLHKKINKEKWSKQDNQQVKSNKGETMHDKLSEANEEHQTRNITKEHELNKIINESSKTKED